MNPTSTHRSIRYIVYEEDDAWFAVALELGIVVDGPDPEVALFSLFEAINGVLEVQSAPQYEGKTFYTPPIDPEYEKMWRTVQDAIQSPYNVYVSGLRQVA